MRAWLLFGALALGVGCGARHDYGDGRGLTGQLEREVVALQQTNRRLQEQLVTCSDGGAPDPIFNELIPVFAGTEAEVSRKQNRTLITLPGSYLFARDRMQLREEAGKALDLLSMVLNQHRDHPIHIEGHVSDRTLSSDLRRTYRDNWALSYARADLVRAELVGRYGVDEARMTVSARANVEPVASSDTPSGLARNDRILITILPPRVP